ncbi:MAG TPA: DNA-directed RNA polymerase subunit omega [Acidimicrobiales bacterium]|nr:DNA-directed RNA polymerase subunit omega [Acidimicrobiales bacterium]
MAQRRPTLMDPAVEELLDKVDSKFTLVALSAKRARQINSYYNQLGEGLGVIVPPQVTSVSGKPLTIAFEEIAEAKATFHRPDPDAESEPAEAVADSGEGGEPTLEALSGPDTAIAAADSDDQPGAGA